MLEWTITNRDIEGNEVLKHYIVFNTSINSITITRTYCGSMRRPRTIEKPIPNNDEALTYSAVVVSVEKLCRLDDGMFGMIADTM